MASPQCENGYTKFANELLDKMCYYITNPTHLRLLLWIGRLTYGWSRKETETNYQSLATKLNLKKETIQNNLRELSDRKFIIFIPISPEKFLVSINKDYERWVK